MTKLPDSRRNGSEYRSNLITTIARIARSYSEIDKSLRKIVQKAILKAFPNQK